MVEQFYQLERNEDIPFGLEPVLRSAGERFGSIMATSLALALGLAPSLFMGDIPGLETIRPMAIVVLGGSSTGWSGGPGNRAWARSA